MGVLSAIFLILSLCCFLPVIAGIDTAQGYGTGGCVMQGIKILSTVLCLLPFGLWFGWDVLGSGWFFLILLGVFILVIFVGSILLEMLGGVFYVIYGGRWLIIFILGLIFLGVGWATHPDEKEKEEDTSAMEIEEEEDELIEEEYADFVGGDDAEALIYKGFCYHDGMNGVKKDYEKALEYWRKAADLGNSEAQYLVGCYYLYGEAVRVTIKSLLNGSASQQRGDIQWGNAYWACSISMVWVYRWTWREPSIGIRNQLIRVLVKPKRD